VSQRDFATLIEVDTSDISSWIAEGKLPRDGTALEWLRAYCKRLRVSAAGRSESLGDERTRVAKEQADKLAMENRVRRGELLEAEIVVAGWVKQVAAFRARSLAIPSKCAPLIAAPNKIAHAQQVLTDAVHEALGELADGSD
jgi:phage terminase Nu1 subunit (DNA packaging protein)